MRLARQVLLDGLDLIGWHEEGLELKLDGRFAAGLVGIDEAGLPVLLPAAPAIEQGVGRQHRVEAAVAVAEVAQDPDVLVRRPEAELVGAAKADQEDARWGVALVVHVRGRPVGEAEQAFRQVGRLYRRPEDQSLPALVELRVRLQPGPVLGEEVDQLLARLGRLLQQVAQEGVVLGGERAPELPVEEGPGLLAELRPDLPLGTVEEALNGLQRELRQGALGRRPAPVLDRAVGQHRPDGGCQRALDLVFLDHGVEPPLHLVAVEGLAVLPL